MIVPGPLSGLVSFYLQFPETFVGRLGVEENRVMTVSEGLDSVELGLDVFRSPFDNYFIAKVLSSEHLIHQFLDVMTYMVVAVEKDAPLLAEQPLHQVQTR